MGINRKIECEQRKCITASLWGEEIVLISEVNSQDKIPLGFCSMEPKCRIQPLRTGLVDNQALRQQLVCNFTTAYVNTNSLPAWLVTSKYVFEPLSTLKVLTLAINTRCYSGNLNNNH